MAPPNADLILWKPSGRDTAERALFANGIVYVTRGGFDLSFRVDPTDRITILRDAAKFSPAEAYIGS